MGSSSSVDASALDLALARICLGGVITLAWTSTALGPRLPPRLRSLPVTVPGELGGLAEGHNLEFAFLAAVTGVGHRQIEPADR